MLSAPLNDSLTKPSVRAGAHRPRVRNDIEGLRAVAVLSVLVNHAFPKALPGGFAGVDIFFVISGYLIGGHLLEDIQAGRFSIVGFYAKRARRIFPALALVLISVWCTGWIVLSATEFAALGRHTVAALFFSNNFLLWSESGYFDTAALDKPLLHLWSLGIEEQFYLLVPAILWMSTRGNEGSIRWVARLGAFSLLATLALSTFDNVSSFYLLHTRFWELAAGVILAQSELRAHAESQHPLANRNASKRDINEIKLFSMLVVFMAILVLGSSGARLDWSVLVNDSGFALAIVAAGATAVLADRWGRADTRIQLRSWFMRQRVHAATTSSLAGVLLIGASVIALRPADWPGPQTLFPVLGAVLVIAAGLKQNINRLLGCRPLAIIGGISYPLYLWHWPAIVFYRLLNPESRSAEMVIPLAGAFALAWLTKIFLEDPVRFGKLGFTVFRRPPLWPVISGLVCAGLLGASAIASDGLPSRFSPQLRAIAEWSEINPDINWRVGHCYFYSNYSANFNRECTPTKRPNVPLILLWGDSHAAHLYSGIMTLQSAMTFDIAQWTSAGCPPTVKPLAGESASCPARRATAMLKLGQLNADTIVLSGAWGIYMAAGQSSDQIIEAVLETIRYIKSQGIRRIVIFGPGPRWNTSLPTDLFRFMAKNKLQEIPERLGRVSNDLWQLDASMAALASAENIRYVSVLKYFCNEDGCLTLGNKALPRPDLLFRDRDHLTVAGSKVLIAHAAPQLIGEY